MCCLVIANFSIYFLQGPVSQWVDVMKKKRAIHENIINQVHQNCSSDNAAKVILLVHYEVWHLSQIIMWLKLMPSSPHKGVSCLSIVSNCSLCWFPYALVNHATPLFPFFLPFSLSLFFFSFWPSSHCFTLYNCTIKFNFLFLRK